MVSAIEGAAVSFGFYYWLVIQESLPEFKLWGNANSVRAAADEWTVVLFLSQRWLCNQELKQTNAARQNWEPRR